MPNFFSNLRNFILGKRKLTLVNPSIGFCDGMIPLGLAYISAYLKKYYARSLKIDLLDANTSNIYKKYKKADIVAISAVTQDIDNAIAFAEFVKKKHKIPVILGGVHVSTAKCLPEPFDIGIIGEGEETMLELMSLKDFSSASLKNIKGICYRNKGEVIFNEERELIKDLDLIPIPDRDIANLEHYLIPRKLIPYYEGRTSTIITSRGCPFNCRFCSTKIHWKRFRAFSAERVIEEIDLLINKYQAEIIHIFDDLFIANKKRLIKIHDYIVEQEINKKVKFMCLVRSDLVDDEIMKILKEMNVVVMGAGMESGSQKILSYLKRDTTTVEMNRRLIDFATKYKIPTMGSFMIGNPEETIEDIQETLDFIVSYRDNPYFTPLTYIATTFPGTDFWEYGIKKGIKVDDYRNIVMDIPNDINKLYKAPLLTGIPLDEFFEIAQKLSVETIFKASKDAELELVSS